MTTADAIVAPSKPLSFKAACIGFVASTTAMTVLMVVAGNLI